MKILHCVEFYNPSVGGAQEVVRQLSEHLVKLGHDVIVATTKLKKRKKETLNGVKIIEFDIKGNAVRGYQGNDLDQYKKLLVKGEFDIIMSYAAQQWTTDLMFSAIDEIKTKTVLVPCGYSGLYDPSYREYFQKLPSFLKQYSSTVYLSHDYRDINYARDNKLENIVIIPNGADENEFQVPDQKEAKKLRAEYGISKDETFLLNVSNHTGAKGHKEAIMAFIQANISDATLMFIGDVNQHSGCYNSCTRQAWINNHLISKLKRDNKRIITASMNRKQTVAAFQACDIFLFLSNIECSPLVLFEAAAAGKPFISSTCGNSQEIAKWLGSGLIVSSTQNKAGYTKSNINSAASAIERLASNKSLRIKMGKKGRKQWEKKYSWEVITKQYEKLYQELFKKQL